MTETNLETPEVDYFQDPMSRFQTEEYKTMQSFYKDFLNSITESPIIPQVGSVVSATYEGLTRGQHFLSVRGFKDDIYIEDRPSESKYLRNAQPGDSIDVLIIEINYGDFFVKGSITDLYESRAHQNLKALDKDTPVMADIISMNPAGYEVEIFYGGVVLKAFMPNTLAGVNKLSDPSSIVGKKMEVMVESYSDHEGTYIVSRRSYLLSLVPEAIENIKYGVPYEGSVTGTAPFGIFVEFNECLTGMIHKVNIDPDWEGNIEDIAPGSIIQFYIKEVIKERGNHKIILTQVLRETLWDTIKKGQILKGVVKDNKAFGSLVTLDNETVGLIHTSELSKIGRKISVGQELDVKVLSLDRSNRKILLTVPQ
jgi:ribosomal protein S1